MFGFCEYCESDGIEVMFVDGAVVCYECAVLTADTNEIEEDEEEAL